MNYEDLHKKFLFARKVSNAIHLLDGLNNPKMKNKVHRMTFLNKLDDEVKDKLPLDVQMGEPVNPELDPLYLHPEDPMKKIVENFIERYIDSPWSSEVNVHEMLLKIVVYGLASPAFGVLAPRGVGKSVAISLIAVMWAFFNAKGEDMFIVAPTTNQTEKVYQYIVDWFEFGKNGLLKNGDPAVGWEGVAHIKFGHKPEIKLRQGTLCRPACASNTNRGMTMRGQQPTFEIIDECSYINDDIYYRTLKAGMGSVRGDHEVVIIESGTPDAKNHFFDLFHDEKKFGHYMKLRFDYKDGIRCNRYTEQRMQQIMDEAGGYDSEEFKSEYRCLFPDSVTGFFKNMDYVFSNPMVEESPVPGMQYVAGIDFGRINDSTVITIGRYEVKDFGDIVDVVHIREINPTEGLTYPEQYEAICDTLADWGVQTAYIDYTGVGIAIYESLVSTAANHSLPTSFVPFTFSGTTKYPAFLRLRSIFQYKPQPRLRYPDIDREDMKDHPCYKEFRKAKEEYKDIIQKRTNSTSEKGKYQVHPSKTRGHDDFVASAICLSKAISDHFSSEIGVAKSESKGTSNHGAAAKKRVDTSVYRTRAPKGLYSKRGHSNSWRHF